MSKPKNMTPEQEAVWKEKIRAKDRAYRKANIEKIRANNKAWREANPEKYRAATNSYREANPEKVRASIKKWRDANKEKERSNNKDWRQTNPEKVRARGRAVAEKLPDCYVAAKLRLPIKDCPPDLLELKRQQLQLKRATKKLKQHLTEAT